MVRLCVSAINGDRGAYAACAAAKAEARIAALGD
jgi:hypothetical protein